MDAKYYHAETEALGEEDLNEITASKEAQRKTFCSEECSHKNTKGSKWWFAKTCMKCITLLAVVSTVLLLAHNINNLGNKLNEGNKQSDENRQHYNHPQSLKSSRLGMSLLNRELSMQSELYDNTNLIDQFKPRVNGFDVDLDANKASTDDVDQAYLKHYLDIGMREDNMMQDCQNPRMKHTFPDIDYALLGYDIFQGFPLADGHDPGFAFPIFAAEYSHGHMTADCRYSVPKGFVVIPDVSCVTSFSSDIIQSTTELSRSLSLNAGVSGGGFGVEFSASAGFKQASSDLKSNEYMYIISTAHCNYYISKFKKENPPPFSQMFFDWIHKLDKSTENDDFFYFFDTFGTHFAKEVTFGARFSYEHKMDSSSFKSKMNSEMNVAAQASYSGLFRVGGGFSLTNDQRREASEFSKSVVTKTITVGAAPPANGDAMTWASTVQNNPVPSEYKLEPIENLFHERYMDHLSVDFKTIASKLEKLKIKYYNRLIAEKYNLDIEKQSNRWITKTLMLGNGNRYGTWQLPQFCPVGTFATGFSPKVKGLNTRDDMTIEGVRLVCVDKLGQPPKDNKTHVQSEEGDMGSWTESELCLPGSSESESLLFDKFALKIQVKDNTRNVSVKGIRFSCRDLQRTRHSYTDGPFAKQITTWSDACPLESAICGIQTHIAKSDGNTLNDIRFYCCGDDSAYLNVGVTF